MMRRLLTAGILISALSTSAHAQNATLWVDANAAHSRPPAGAAIAAASYGLLGARLRLDRRGSALELGALTGRSAEDGGGGWISGRASLEAARVKGVLDGGIHADASGLTYISPVRIGTATEYRQSAALATLRPFAGLSVAGFRIGAEATITEGIWRSEATTSLISDGPGLPLPGGSDDVQGNTTRNDGRISVNGGAASILKIVGPASVHLSAGRYTALNQVEDGSYTGVDAKLALSVGAADVALGIGRWHTPADSAVIGAHATFGVSIGERAYVQASASRGIPDPVYGSRGDASFSAGVSIRLGSAALGPPAPAAVGAVSGSGRVVRFVLRADDARTVAVAGDFSGWEQRALQRADDGTWTLETVLQPGVYHYSFVIDGTEWRVPESATGIVDDGFGQKNATLIVTASEDR